MLGMINEDLTFLPRVFSDEANCCNNGQNK